MYQVWVITVFTVFRLLTDIVCLYTYEFWLSLCEIAKSSVILLLPLLYVLLRCAASDNPISIFKLLLFQTRIVRTKLDIYPFYHYDCVDTPTGGLLVSECIIPPNG
jgi:hypothetical protein